MKPFLRLHPGIARCRRSKRVPLSRTAIAERYNGSTRQARSESCNGCRLRYVRVRPLSSGVEFSGMSPLKFTTLDPSVFPKQNCHIRGYDGYDSKGPVRYFPRLPVRAYTHTPVLPGFTFSGMSNSGLQHLPHLLSAKIWKIEWYRRLRSERRVEMFSMAAGLSIHACVCFNRG